MKILILLITITFSSAFASPKNWPDVPYTYVVAYCYDFTQDKRGSSITFPDGSLHAGIINATTLRLSEEQTKSLVKIINEDSKYERGEVDCYDPHHAFVFYDANWKVVAYIEICFLCEDYKFSPAGASKLIDLQALEIFCRQIDLPWYEKSEDYTKLYIQQQPKADPNKAQEKRRKTDNNNPFENPFEFGD